jgi:2-oxo-4-hydroxy-4-carboxy--5-ureidoimidazoline (OHCU) decarboxylase
VSSSTGSGPSSGGPSSGGPSSSGSGPSSTGCGPSSTGCGPSSGGPSSGGPSSSAVGSISELDRLSDDACAAALAPLFEGAPRFLVRLCARRPFRDEATLFATAREVAHAIPEHEQLELIDAHPRLGAPPASVSALSFVEQGYDLEREEAAEAGAAGAGRTGAGTERAGAAGAGRTGAGTERAGAAGLATTGSAETARSGAAVAGSAETERARVSAELDRLNRAYEARFGFRYCVFVAGRPRAALLPGFEAALSADRADEIERALDAVVDIAADRWARLTEV